MNVLTLIMAGGQGTGLGLLTAGRCKPAVPMVGSYRLIDFVLSNVANSDLAQVAVLTQHAPHSLIRHIGDGAPWNLHRRAPDGVQIWHPHPQAHPHAASHADGLARSWYGGTADALHKNRDLIAASGAELLLIVCGDHVYRQDYRPLLDFHRAKGAQVTIAVTRVPPEDTHRFGIVRVDANQRITAFTEKPASTDSTLASTGIYVVDTPFFLERLDEDARDPGSQHEIGRSMFPAMVARDAVFAYAFPGAWIDVGTIAAYWQTNMAFLDAAPVDLADPAWPIRTRTDERPPAWHGRAATVRESLIAPGGVIEGTVIRSVLSPGVHVERDAVVRDSIVLHGGRIRAGASVDRCVLDKETEIGGHAHVGGRQAVRSPQPAATSTSTSTYGSSGAGRQTTTTTMTTATAMAMHGDITVIGRRTRIPSDAPAAACRSAAEVEDR